MVKKISLNEKILIAGVRGMAGSAIFRALQNSGYGNRENGGCFFTPSKKELNYLKYENVDDWFQRNLPSVVIIAAAKVGGIIANKNYPADFLIENILIQTNLIQASRKYKVKRLLFLGSSCIYPKLSQQPIKEEYLLNGYLEPTNEPYALAKICGIKMCESLRRQYGFDCISLMPTNLYGPGDNYHKENSHVMASLIRKFSEGKRSKSPYVTCWGTGEPKREFMHVDDLGTASVHALEIWDPSANDAPKDNEGSSLSFLNVGTGKEISIKELAEKIAKIVKYEGEIRWDKSKPDGTFRKRLDISKIKQIGWEPKIDLDDGITKTILKFKQI